jgi:Ca2+:H+ antiporter
VAAWGIALATLALIGAVILAVHHAEVVAHRVGEPFGTLVLAVAITIIEAALILSLMLSGGKGQAVLARDTIFAALMIITSGLIGVCLFAGGLRHREQVFRTEGAVSGLAALMTLAVLSLILPNFTTTTFGGTYAPAQLIAVAVVSLAIWGTYVAVQTGRHRDYFLPVGGHTEDHAPPPTVSAAWASFGVLLVCLVAVVGLAKWLSKPLEQAVQAAGAPQAVVGLAIALTVLLPETGAAIRAARANRFQTSMNLAMGSALASIGLTIPTVAVASLMMGLPLELGLEGKHIVLLVLACTVNALTLGLGRSNILLGVIHLSIFAAFVVIAFVP